MKPFSNTPKDDDETEDLIGIALGLLDDEPLRGFLQIHSPLPDEVSEARSLKVDRIRQNLYLLLDDGLDDESADAFEPPSGLLDRTRSRIKDYEQINDELREPLIFKPRWRAADIAVAASVFFAFVLGSIPALQRAQFTSANLACSSNLLQLWRGMEQYSTSYNMYANAAVHDNRLPVGATISLLLHSGHLDKTVPLTCPSCPDEVCVGELPSWQELRNFTEELDLKFTSLLAEAYAIHPGVAGTQGVRHLERSKVDPFRAILPLVADRPTYNSKFQVQAGNSPTHGGYGQNVIFADGHTSFIRNRQVGKLDNDLYTNRDGNAAVATDPLDMILVPAATHLPSH